jgi:hypothetical protein
MLALPGWWEQPSCQHSKAYYSACAAAIALTAEMTLLQEAALAHDVRLTHNRTWVASCKVVLVSTRHWCGAASAGINHKQEGLSAV